MGLNVFQEGKVQTIIQPNNGHLLQIKKAVKVQTKRPVKKPHITSLERARNFLILTSPIFLSKTQPKKIPEAS